MSRIAQALLLWWLCLFAIPVAFCRHSVHHSVRYSGRHRVGNKEVHGHKVVASYLATPNNLSSIEVIFQTKVEYWNLVGVSTRRVSYRLEDLFMAAEPSVGRRRRLADGSWQDPASMQTISEEMDADLAMDENGGGTAAAAVAASAQVEGASSAASAGVAENSETPTQQRATRIVAQRGAMNANNDVVVDPRLLSKPGSCPSERGASWRLWRTKFEGWTFGVDNRIGLAVVQAAEHPVVINLVPQHLRQASSFIYAELLGSTSGVQMEIVLEVDGRNGFEAWWCLV